MPIEKNILPDFVIAQIYGSHLVLGTDLKESEKKTATIKETKTVVAKETSPVTEQIIIAPNPPIEVPVKLNFLGNNGKQISILVKESEMPFINDKDLQFLSAILSACKLNVGDVAIINFDKTPINFEQLKKETTPKYVLLFEVSPKEIKLPFTIPHYQVQSHDQCKFIYAPALSTMDGKTAAAIEEKTKLWNSLKKIFEL